MYIFKDFKKFFKQAIKRTKSILFLLTLLLGIKVVMHIIELNFFEINEKKHLWDLIQNFIKYFIILNISWLIFIILEIIIEKYIALKIKKTNKAKTVFRVLDTIIKISFLVILFLYSLDFWGVDITKFLAAGGIMGLAIGLAAKDFLSNLFGGLVIFLDRPFSEGEWICSPDRNIEGTVKKIKLRVTEIETFDKRPLYIPNSTFLNIIIENPNRMKNRRICEDFSLRYQDAKQVKKIVYEIENFLKQHPAIEVESTIMVHLTRFSASSLDCQVYCFTKTASWKLYREIKQEVMLQVIDIVKQNEADIAFPTRMIEFKEDTTELSSKKTLPSLKNKGV